MENKEKKESHQIVIYPNKTVCESRVFENIVLNDLSSKQIQILMLLASQIGEEDTDFYRYQISMSKLCKIFCKNSRDKDSIKSIEKALEDMRSKTVKFVYHIDDEDGVEHEVKRITGWIDEVEIVDSKTVYFKMAHWLKNFFLNIPREQRIIYKVAYLFQLKRKGAINIYRWAYSLKGFNNPVNISMEDAKIKFCGDPKRTTRNFIRDYVDAGIKEINEKTDLHIDYKLNTRDGEGHKYTSITFYIEQMKNIGSKISKAPKTKKTETLIEEKTVEDIKTAQEIHEEIKRREFEYKRLHPEHKLIIDENGEVKEIPVYNLFDD